MRKSFVAMVLALALVGCDSASQTQTVSEVVAGIQKACGFSTSAEPIARVIATIVSGFDPAAGATATVAISVGKAVVDKVCDAVKASTTVATAGITDSTPVTVVINGVPVPGVVKK